MDKLVFSDKYLTGIKEIDEQHATYFRLVDEVSRLADREDLTEEKAQIILHKFNNYALYHLSTEEIYFEQCHYNGAEEHIVQHEEYRKKVREYLSRMRGNGSEDLQELLVEISTFGKVWLLGHILSMDMKYVEDLRACGIE